MPMPSIRAAALLFSGVLLGLVACQGDNPGGGEDDGDGTGGEPQVEPSSKHDLQWKRAYALERDLMRALELEADEVCLEAGSEPCISQVHLVALGGHDPIGLGLYESLADPLTTTPIAVDRVMLSACGSRAEADASGGAVVFTDLDLSGPAPEASNEAVGGTATALYRRLLSRDPLAEEIELLAQLTVDDAGDPVSAVDFAKLACFTVASSTEFLFF